MNNFIKEIKKILEEFDLSILDEFVKLLKLVRGFKSTVFLAGNGGHFCECQHFGQDLLSFVINNDSIPIKSFVLGGNIGTFSALANDFSYDKALIKELKVYCRKNKGNIIVCMSGSGNSKNILEVAKWGQLNEIPVVSFTGNDGGQLKHFSNIHINVPSSNWVTIHGIHNILFHLILEELIKSTTSRLKP